MFDKPRQKRSWGELFAYLLGWGESKKLTIWFMVSIIIGLVANFVILLGCLSPATKSIYMFRVSSQNLVDAATNVTRVSAKDLRLDELPNHWYWGLSGVCMLYPGDGTPVCERSFPPTFTTEDMIAMAVKGKLGDEASESAIARKIKPWTQVLSQVEDDVPPSARSESLFKAAVALTLISTILSFLVLPLAVLSLSLLRGKLQRWAYYGIAMIDTTAFLGAGILVIYAMNDGPRSLIQLSGIDQGNERTFIGPGFYVLFAGVLFKLISIGIFFTIAFIIVILIVFAIISCISEAVDGDSGSSRKEIVVIEVPTYEYENKY
ncbi:hypothetical protein NM208_g13207 [Fusarium decemcellulare]|uniref:Uncharacterized protein n=1 Tax=Fusarium decemcellulare TaxID=57161 RepID=A0ACC1RKM8_9HYPO|nr:hypothetical protein NM208_g13207 [Fusarium decemcellulare]